MNSIRQVLEAVHAVEGGYYWSEDTACPLGPLAEVACEAGYIKPTSDGALGVFEGYQITRLGREYLELSPTLADRLYYAFLRLMPQP